MRIFLSFGMMVFLAVNLQAQLNDYKYVIVPKRFDIFKNVNQHQTSTLIKHLFNSNGFKTVYDDEVPDELYNNRCMGLTVKLDDQSSMFTTKTMLVLEDCEGKSVFMSQEGRSREKDFKVSYKEAITQSFQSIEALNYAYSGTAEHEPVTLSFKNDVKSLKETANTEKTPDKLTEKAMVEQEATLENQRYESKEPVPSTYEKGTPQTEEAVEQLATVEEQSYEDKTPVESAIVKSPVATRTEKPSDLGVLYAQELPTGFQLVDSSPQIVMTLFKTSMKDVYAAKYGDINGMVFKKDDKWLFDYTDGQALIQKELNIKF